MLRSLPFPVPDRAFPLMESYEVFNAEQFDRLPPRFQVDTASPAPGPRGRIDIAEDFFKAVGAEIVPGGDRAAYDRFNDIIRMPVFGSFDDPVLYYATLAHEAVHWTGHPWRIRREFGVRRGDPAYAFEEIVAELGASFVMGRLGLPCRVEGDHAPYVDHWVSVLENDERAIHRAASHAQRAADFLVIATASERVRELAERPLDDRAWIVVYLDIVDIGPHPLVGAVGLDTRGTKRVLGRRRNGARMGGRIVPRYGAGIHEGPRPPVPPAPQGPPQPDRDAVRLARSRRAARGSPFCESRSDRSDAALVVFEA